MRSFRLGFCLRLPLLQWRRFFSIQKFLFVSSGGAVLFLVVLLLGGIRIEKGSMYVMGRVWLKRYLSK